MTLEYRPLDSQQNILFCAKRGEDDVDDDEDDDEDDSLHV